MAKENIVTDIVTSKNGSTLLDIKYPKNRKQTRIFIDFVMVIGLGISAALFFIFIIRMFRGKKRKEFDIKKNEEEI